MKFRKSRWPAAFWLMAFFFMWPIQARQNSTALNMASSTAVPAADSALPAGEARHAPDALAAFQSGQSLKPLVVASIASPKYGQAFYALKGLSDCRLMDNFSDVRDLAWPKSDSTDSSEPVLRRKAAIDYLKRRCDGILPTEIDDLTRQVVASADGTLDPLLKAQSDFLSAFKNGDPAGLKKALGDIFATQDPALLDSVGAMIGLSGRDNEGALLFHFEGVDYRLRDDPSISAAISLIPCELGLRCDGREGLIGLHCANGGNCSLGRHDELKNGIFKNDRASYETAVRLARRLAKAVRDGNVEAFTP